MAFEISCRVGPFGIKLGDGSVERPRMLYDTTLATADAHARYMEAVLRGNVYVASNVAAAAITNLAAAATGLILSNPVGSTVKLVLMRARIAQAVAAAAAIDTIELAANVNPQAVQVVHTTPLVPQNCLLGNQATPVGKADSSATLPASPIVLCPLYSPSISATATTSVPPVISEEFSGEFVLLPGTAVSLSATTAISAISSFTWEEVPL